jgi:hypothetical protein
MFFDILLYRATRRKLMGSERNETAALLEELSV